jgi:hypothetical protein
MAEINVRSILIPKIIKIKINSNEFILPDNPEPNTLQVLRNGVETNEGVNRDYVLNNRTITIRFHLTSRTQLTFKYFIRKVLHEL